MPLIPSIHDCIYECSLDILAVTESWHSDGQDLTFCRAIPNGYACLAVSRAESDVSFEGKTKSENVRGGGVVMIHRDCWRVSKINIQDKLTSFEFLCTRVDVKSSSIIVCTVYRSQPITDKFFDEFRRLLEQLVTHRCPLSLLGILISTLKRMTTCTPSALTGCSNHLGCNNTSTIPLTVSYSCPIYLRSFSD